MKRSARKQPWHVFPLAALAALGLCVISSTAQGQGQYYSTGYYGPPCNKCRPYTPRSTAPRVDPETGEELPPEEDVKKLERRVKSEDKNFVEKPDKLDEK